MVKSIQEVNSYVIKNKLERKLNSSFNKAHINSPKITFYSVEKINKFCLTGQALTYQNYYDFLSAEFPDFPKFSVYLKAKVDYWKTKEPDINEHDALIYLLKKFVVDPIDGKISELETKQIIAKRFPDFSITEPTPEEDMRECFDFKLDNGSVCFYFQHKPKSFFYNLKERTKFSFYKVKKASERYNKPIFFTKKERGTVYIYLRSKKDKNKVSFIPLKDFLIEHLSQTNIQLLSKRSFERIDKCVIN